MQQAGPSTQENLASPAPTRARLNPLVVFMALILLATGAGLYLMSRSGVTSDRDNGQPPVASSTLTNSEAVKRFTELEHLLRRAYEARDLRLLADLVVPDTPMEHRISREITQLKEDDVILRTRIETTSLSVSVNEPDVIHLRQVAVVDLSFKDETGEDVGQGGLPELQVTTWTLRSYNDEWLFSASVLESAKPVGDSE